ncbi:MAG: hypothetical protein AB7V07_05500 [Candidatus Delongbacteria bacterium]
MKRIFILFLFFTYAVSFSRTIYGEALYTYGDNETLVEAKQKCQTFAKRDAVEKFATFLRSETIVRNYETEKDEIIANAEAMMTNIQILEEKIDKAKTTVFYRISAEVDEKKILGVYEEKERMRLEQAEAERKAQELRLEAERKALENQLEHERELARIAAETEKYKMSRELSEKDRRFWRTQKWIGLGAFVGSAALGTYFNAQSDSYYDDYRAATSSSDAIDYFDKANSYKDYRNITYSVSLVPLGYFFYAWYKESKY